MTNKQEKEMTRKISSWKNQGIICEDWISFYYRVIQINYCESCYCELCSGGKNKSNTKVLDHDHDIKDKENIRNILCNKCNTQRTYYWKKQHLKNVKYKIIGKNADGTFIFRQL